MFAVVLQNQSRKYCSCRVGVRLVCASLLIAAAASVHAQSSSLIGGASVLRLQQEQKMMAAEARQKKMASDADKLVQMAQQLKVSVDKTNKDMLSVDVIREAERIEKLAREVREGMRQ